MSNPSKPHILVTGGAGYIGSHTVRLLAELDYQVTVLDNLQQGHPESLPPKNAYLVSGNIDDTLILEQLFAQNNFAAVIHFAAFLDVGESVREPLKYYENNLAAPLALLKTMHKHKVKNFVLSSTCAVYGEPEKVPISEANPKNPVNSYGRSKHFLEEVLTDCERAWGLKSVCLRYFNAAGTWGDGSIGEDHEPEIHLIPRILMTLKGELPKLSVYGTDYDTPDGTCIRDYIHVRDLAQAHVSAFNHLNSGKDSLRCNLGTGTGSSVLEIIAATEEVTGKKIPVEYGERRPGDPARLIADPTLAQNTLGWKAQKSLKNIIEDAWTWFNRPEGRHYQQITKKNTLSLH